MPDAWQLGVGDERARVAIVGCGGAGCNILRHVTAPARAIRIAVNDTVHPSMADIPSRVLVPAASLQAYASMDEKAVQTMETDEEKKISAVLLDRDVILILGGLGGELGGWGMSLVGRVARILGDATLALATVPFTMEGPIRRQLAEAQLQLLQKRVDGVVTFSNDRLLQVARDLPLTKAFAALGAIMARPASGLSDVLGRADVAPLRRMLGRVREWRFGMGAGREKHRCFVAVEEAYIALVHVATGGSEIRGRPGVVPGWRRRRGGNSPANPLAFPAGRARLGNPVASSRRRSRGRASPRRRLSSTERIRGGIFSAIIAK